MARLEVNDYLPISVQSLEKPILFVVDMVNGFVKEGALHDVEISKIIEPIQRLIESLSCEKIFVQDCHVSQASEFLSYPVHCLQGTKESEIVDELRPFVSRVILKNNTNTFISSDFQKMIGILDDVNDIIITGCCTDLCILQFALTLKGWLNEHNYTQRVIIPVNCVDTYNISGVHDAKEWNIFALKNMEMNGILIVDQIKEEKV